MDFILDNEAMMQRQIILLALIGLVASKSCLDCICQVESNCRNVPCKPDGGSDSCGYYQIKRAYYLDCGKPEKRSGESTDTAWERCAASKSCSEKCVQNYVNRYKENCSGMSVCQTMARLHNGGPNGCRIRATLGYWNKVRGLGCS